MTTSSRVWRSFTFAVAAVYFVLALQAKSAAGEASWQAEWERTVKLAETEGQVSFYTLGDSHNYVAEFQKKFPKIKVVMVPGRGSELLTRMMAERRGEKHLADVARIGNTSPYALYRAKALQPIPPALILPEVKDESKWWQGKHHYSDPEGKYIFVPIGSASLNMVSYNPEMVSPGEFKSYWDLLEPKWKGKLVVMDPRAGGYGRSGARFVYYNKGLGPEYLTRLFGTMDVTVSRQYHQAIDWVAQKRFPLHLFGNGGDVLDAKSKGLQINVMDTADWKEGAGLEPSAFTFVLMDKAPHPNAAKVFLNWVLSKEGQTAIQKEGETNDSLRIDIPKDDVAPVMRRRSAAQYVVTWTPEWMNMKPIQELVVQALGESKKK